MSWSWEVESLKHTEKCACIIKVRCAKNSMITWSIYKHGIDTVYVYVWIFITTYIRLILRRIIKQINIKKKKKGISCIIIGSASMSQYFPKFYSVLLLYQCDGCHWGITVFLPTSSSNYSLLACQRYILVCLFSLLLTVWWTNAKRFF